MLFLSPTILIDDLPLPGVLVLAVDRAALRAVEHHGDFGPHTIFADVPEQRTTVVIRRRLDEEDPLDLVPGQAVSLVFFTHEGAGDAHRLRHAAAAVVLSTRTDFDARPASGSHASAPVVRTITLVALSSDGGGADPFTVGPAPLDEP